MDSHKIVQEVINQKGYYTNKMAKEQDVSSFVLSDMTSKNLIKRVERGLYISVDGVYDPYFTFQFRHNKAVFSFYSALYLHGMTDVVPEHMEVSVYQGYNAHRFDASVRVHYVRKNVHELGVVEVLSPFGQKVRTYDIERTLCDLLIKKSHIEIDVFKQSFHTYFNDPTRNKRKLMEYAQILGVEEKMRLIVELLET